MPHAAHAAAKGAVLALTVVERTITARPGDPKAVPYAGLYLASDEAVWVTRPNIVVDGGVRS